MNTLHRFHDRAAAIAVFEIAQRLTNAKLYLDYNDHGETREDPAGNWRIGCDVAYDIMAKSTLSNCVRDSVALALADQLRKVGGKCPLTEIWHLREENREKLYRYYVEFPKGS